MLCKTIWQTFRCYDILFYVNPNAEKNAGKSRQIMLNMAASMLSTLVSLAISFVLSPIIIEKLDFEAQGFMTLATDFVSYANIAAMALNSMAGRFITVSLTKGDLKKANEYFNSTMYANMGIVGFLFIPSVLIVLFLDKLINISPALMADVKILFALTFINFFITIVSTTFSTATFAANRLDLQALRSIESQFIRMGILMLTFFLLPIHISYVALASLLQTSYLCITYIHYTKKLLPDIHVSREYFSLSSVLEILSSGIWNTVMRAGQTLTNGLDILITNLLIGEKEMGYVSTSKMIVISIDTLYETIAAVFTPSLTISFAKDDKEEMLSDLKSAMKLTGFFANIPLCFVIAFGLTFYTVWLPKTTTNDELVIIYILTLLTMSGTIVGGAISPLFNVYTVVNKLKWNSIITLLMGVMNTIIVFILLETTPLSVFAVAGVSSALGIIKNLTFTPMYAAHCLNVKKSTFYPVIIRYIVVSGVMAALFIGFEKLIPVYYNWGYIILSVFACGIAGCIINLLFLFEKKERAMFWDVLGRLIKKR